MDEDILLVEIPVPGMDTLTPKTRLPRACTLSSCGFVVHDQ